MTHTSDDVRYTFMRIISHLRIAMIGCPLCGEYSPSMRQLLTHIRLVHADEPGFYLQCGIQGCSWTFRKYQSFRNHVYATHDGTTCTSTPHVEGDKDTTEQNEGEDNVYIQGVEYDHDTLQLDDVTDDALQRAAALFILKTRENHRIPISIMDTIIGDVSSLYTLALSAIKKQVISILQLNGEGVESAVADLFDTSHFANVFLGLETHYQQLQYIKRNFNFVVLLDFVFVPMMIMFHIV